MATKTVLVIIFLTVLLGGGAAIMMGRNFATNWRPAGMVILSSVGLALGVRFLHYALFQEQLLTPTGLLIDFAILAAMGLFGWQWRRAEQLTTQYYWLYERTGLLKWRPITKTDDNR